VSTRKSRARSRAPSRISNGNREVDAAAKRETPAAAKGNDKKWGLTNNALVAGVVSAFVAGIISLVVSLLVTHFQDQSAASQARSAQQALAAEQLEAAASNLYSTTQNVYNFQLKCVGTNETWTACASLAPDLRSYSAALTTFAAIVANVGDPAAAELANQFSKESTGSTVAAPSAAKGERMWNALVTTYVDLIARCGQLIRAQ
jgi:hypothetical protein